MGLVGTITKVFRDKGFAFSRGTDGKEYFVHRSQTDQFDNLREGDKIEFTPTDTPKGPRAHDVRPV